MKAILFSFFLLVSNQAFSSESCKSIETIKIMTLHGSDSLLDAGQRLDAQLNGRFEVSHVARGSFLIYPVRQYILDDNQKLEIHFETQQDLCKDEVEKLKAELLKLEYTEKKLDILDSKISKYKKGSWIDGNDVFIYLTQKHRL